MVRGGGVIGRAFMARCSAGSLPDIVSVFPRRLTVLLLTGGGAGGCFLAWDAPEYLALGDRRSVAACRPGDVCHAIVLACLEGETLLLSTGLVARGGVCGRSVVRAASDIVC